MLQNIYEVDVDIKQKTAVKTPTVTQNDTVVFIFRIFDEGRIYNIQASGTTFTLLSTRTDKQTVMREGTVTGENIVQFDLGTTELNVVGKVESVIQVYDVTNERVSTIPFSFNVLNDPSTDYVPSAEENTLIQRVLGDGPQIIDDAEAATTNANSAADSTKINWKGVLTTYGELPATPFLGDTYQIENDATTSNNGTWRWNGTAWVKINSPQAYDTRLINTEEKLSEQSKQTAALVHGVNVLNTSQATSFDPVVKGRSLANLWLNATTEDLKYYIANFYSRNVGLSLAGVYTYANTKFQGVKAIAPVLMADFVGKVAGSTVENPHIQKFATGSPTTLLTPSTFGSGENTPTTFQKLDGSLLTHTQTANGSIAQTLFSFNLIRHIEDLYGTIPRSTTADKVQWIKDNVKKITSNWHGFGSSPAGNKASFKVWSVAASAWVSATGGTHANSAVTKLTQSSAAITADAGTLIDANGMFHVLAYAEASDGVTASTINTDYINLEVELKNGTKLRPTKIGAGLYEVDAATYNLVNVDTAYTGQKLLDKYPYVDGVKHVQNPALTVQGKNLLPPFTEWTLHANATVKSAYELELVATALDQNSYVTIPVLPNTSYTLSISSSEKGEGYWLDSNGVYLSSPFSVSNGSQTKISPSNAVKLHVRVTNRSASTGTFTFTNPQLELGSTASDFEPKNEDVLYATTKLGSDRDGNAKDELYKRDGQWYRLKRWEKDVVLDGSFAWGFNTDYTGYKRVFLISLPNEGVANKVSLVKHDGNIIKVGDTSAQADIVGYNPTNTYDFYVSISDTDTGFTEAQVPTANMIKGYFNGWKYTGDGTTHSWVNIIDGTAAPTQTEAYVSTTLATGYTPYSLSYQLAVSKEETVTVEGAVSLHEGGNQVDVASGVIARENVVPRQEATLAFIGHNSSITSQPSKKVLSFISIFKNGVIDKKWVIDKTAVWRTNSNIGAYIPMADFDSTAEYTVSYLVLDKHLFTTNASDVSGTYNTNLKTNVDGLTERVGDNSSNISVLQLQMIDVIARLKAGGL
jgi:hypothetical protein